MPLRLLAAVAALLAGIALAFWCYRGIAVFRMELRDFTATPDDLNEATQRSYAAAAAAARIVYWRLDDGHRQRAFYLPPKNGAVVIYAHGAPGAGTGMLPEALDLASAGFGGLLLDLPGYGGSDGRRDWGPQFRSSVRHAVDFIAGQPEVDSGRIGGFGYSMGGYLIARAAAEDPRIGALVLLAAFTNLSDQLKAQFASRVPGLGHVAIAAAHWSGVPVQAMDTSAALRALGGRPVFIVSGKEDRAIPQQMPIALSRAAPGAELWLIEGAGHTGFSDVAGRVYFERLRAFWTKALLGTKR